MSMLRALILVGLALAALAVLPAQAHNAGSSTSRLTISERSVSVEINALELDYEKAAGVRLIEAGSGVVNAVALAVMAPSVLRYVGDHVAVLIRRPSLLADGGNGTTGRHPRSGHDRLDLSFRRRRPALPRDPLSRCRSGGPPRGRYRHRARRTRVCPRQDRTRNRPVRRRLLDAAARRTLHSRRHRAPSFSATTTSPFSWP